MSLVLELSGRLLFGEQSLSLRITVLRFSDSLGLSLGSFGERFLGGIAYVNGISRRPWWRAVAAESVLRSQLRLVLWPQRGSGWRLVRPGLQLLQD